MPCTICIFGKTMSEAGQRSPRLLIVCILVVCVGCLVASLGVPNYVNHNSGPSKTSIIIFNLRQLDGAKQQWALDHGRTGSVVVTEQDIAIYLKRGGIRPVAGERYILNLLTQSPEAELTHKALGRPQGTRFRLGATNDYEIVLPNKPHSANSRRGSQRGFGSLQMASVADAERSALPCGRQALLCL